MSLVPYLGAVVFVYVWQAGADWAKWPLLSILIGVALFAIVEVGRRRFRAKPEGYVGKFRTPDGTVVHVARMGSGKLWAASDTQPPAEIGYVDGRELARWQKLATTPDN